jgi:hypothetical protein
MSRTKKSLGNESEPNQALYQDEPEVKEGINDVFESMLIKQWRAISTTISDLRNLSLDT